MKFHLIGDYEFLLIYFLFGRVGVVGGLVVACKGPNNMLESMKCLFLICIEYIWHGKDCWL